MTSAETTLVITGAAGRIGSALVPLLRRPDRRLRLVDRSQGATDDSGADVSWHLLDVADEEGLRAVFAGAEAVVHLAGLSRESSWDDILRVNVAGTQHVLEAARRAGVRRLMLASSVHAVGYTTADEARKAAVLPPRPDTFYGWSKAAVEALGSLYADRYGMTIVSARICTFQPVPRDDGRTPALWLSPADAAKLVEASIALDDGAHHIVWGVSANAPAWLPLIKGHEIGFAPADDAVDTLARTDGVTPKAPDPAQQLGGAFVDPQRPLGSSW
jgi:nucleoside-diphosphate-sugar epimerase